MAMTAWSAKVSTSSICLSVKGRPRSADGRSPRGGCPRAASARPAPSGSRQSLLNPPIVYSGSAVTSGSGSSCAPARPGRWRTRARDRAWIPRRSPRATGIRAVVRGQRETRRRRPEDGPASAPQSRVAFSSSVPSTGWRSNVERLMTLRPRSWRSAAPGLGEVAVPDFELLEEPDVLGGNDGLIGEHLRRATSASEKGTTSRRETTMTPTDRASLTIGTATYERWPSTFEKRRDSWGTSGSSSCMSRMRSTRPLMRTRATVLRRSSARIGYLCAKASTPTG